MRKSLLTLLLLVSAASQAQSSPIRIDSPDHAVSIQVAASPLRFSVTFHNRPVLTDSALGLAFANQPALGPMRLGTPTTRTSDTTWTPVWGKTATIRNQYNETTIPLQESSAPHRKLTLIVRATPEGAAFRYLIPTQPGLEHFILEKELTTFHFPTDPTVWAGSAKSFHHPYEQEYPESLLSALKPGPHIVLPVLARVAPDTYAAITEAELTDWAGLYFNPSGTTLEADLSPRLDHHGLVESDTPHASPWRVILLARTPGALIESNLIDNLSTPNKIADTSWIKPGMMAWDHWWSGDVQMDNDTVKSYISLASSMGWPYQLIDWQWYGPFNKPEADITKPAPQLDWPGILAFAKAHNVREWIWIHSNDITHAKDAGTLDSAFALYEKWGIAGVKIDFMDSNDQAMVRWYEDVVSLAAKHHLMVDFHGAFVPTGLRVTWPNLLTREGVMGNEYNKFSTRVTPLHKLTLPFTRLLAGPMDYTPGGFLNRSPAEWKQTTPTQVMGSRAQELALFVVYWSPLTCVTDSPEHYKNQPGLDFLRVVPTIWDETKVLDGAVGQHIVVARRKGDGWFLGAMTSDNKYTVTIPLTFLTPGKYRLHGYTDPTDPSASYEAVTEVTKTLSNSDTLTISMRPAGGAAFWLERLL